MFRVYDVCTSYSITLSQNESESLQTSWPVTAGADATAFVNICIKLYMYEYIWLRNQIYESIVNIHTYCIPLHLLQNIFGTVHNK